MVDRANIRSWLSMKTLGAVGMVAVLTALSATATAQNPPQPAAGAADAAAGRRVFDRVCGRCHPNGEEDVGPRLTNRNDPEAEVRTTIRNGHGRMRPIRTTGRNALADADMPALFVYLRSIHAMR